MRKKIFFSLQADWVLIDEGLGRRVALGLPVKGTLGILLVAVRASLERFLN